MRIALTREFGQICRQNFFVFVSALMKIDNSSLSRSHACYSIHTMAIHGSLAGELLQRFYDQIVPL